MQRLALLWAAAAAFTCKQHSLRTTRRRTIRRLFLEEAPRLGGDLNRASMVKALSKVKDWTSNGLHSPQDVGGKTTGKCQKIIRYTGGSWKQVSKGDYLCDTLVTTGVGA